MTTKEIATARDISDRRMNYLISKGEDVRRTAAWRDAVAERNQIERAIAFTSWRKA